MFENQMDILADTFSDIVERVFPSELGQFVYLT